MLKFIQVQSFSVRSINQIHIDEYQYTQFTQYAHNGKHIMQHQPNSETTSSPTARRRVPTRTRHPLSSKVWHSLRLSWMFSPQSSTTTTAGRWTSPSSWWPPMLSSSGWTFLHLTWPALEHRLSSESDQLNWIFNVYDKNCGGTIDPEVWTCKTFQESL